MHPNVLNSQVNTLLDDLLCHLGTCQDEYSIHFFRDGFQVRVTGIAVECNHVRADGEYLIPVFLEVAIGQITAGVALLRNPDDRDLLEGREAKKLQPKLESLC